jgi:hypothetical protein
VAGKPEELARRKLMMWRVGWTAGSDGDTFLAARLRTEQGPGQSRASICPRTTSYATQRTLPDGPGARRSTSKQKLFVAYAPYKLVGHRIETSVFHPWVIGFRRHPFICNFWKYVDNPRRPGRIGRMSGANVGRRTALKALAAPLATTGPPRRTGCRSAALPVRGCRNRLRSGPGDGSVFEIVTAHLRQSVLLRPSGAAIPDPAEHCGRRMPRPRRISAPGRSRKPGIYFQDDPVFNGSKRELVAADYVYSWKRFFDPRWKAPAYASLNELKMLGMAALREAALKGKAPFDYDTPIDGMRALDRYTLQFRFAEPQPRFLQAMSGGDLWGAVAREVVEAYGDAIPAHPVGTGPFRLSEWRRSSRIVLERNPAYRELAYDARPNADDAEGRALLAKFKGRRVPMIDRVEIAIVEKRSRAVSFLNKQYDILYLLPYEFVNIAVPNGKLAPNLARQGVQMYPRAGVRYRLADVLQHGGSVVGGYTPDKVALRRAIGLAIDVDQEIRLFWRGQAVPAQSPMMPNTVGYDAKFVSANGTYDLRAGQGAARPL